MNKTEKGKEGEGERDIYRDDGVCSEISKSLVQTDNVEEEGINAIREN